MMSDEQLINQKYASGSYEWYAAMAEAEARKAWNQGLPSCYQPMHPGIHPWSPYIMPNPFGGLLMPQNQMNMAANQPYYAPIMPQYYSMPSTSGGGGKLRKEQNDPQSKKIDVKEMKKRRDKQTDSGKQRDPKECRVRLGVYNTGIWCKACKRKQPCLYSSQITRGSDLTDLSDLMHSTLMGMHLSPSALLRRPPPETPPTEREDHEETEEDQKAKSKKSDVHGTSLLEENDSDSESSFDDEEEIDPAISALTSDVILGEQETTEDRYV